MAWMASLRLLMMWLLGLVSVFEIIPATSVTGGDYPVVYCSPKLWEGGKWSLRITHTDHGPGIVESTSLVSVDVIGQRIAVTETGSRNGQHFNVSYLFYYPAKTLFAVQNGSCAVHVLSGNFSQQCQQNPDPNYNTESLWEWLGMNSETHGPALMTMGGSGVLQGLGFFYNQDMQHMPLIEERDGLVNGIPTYTLDNYFNITLGIKDPRVFTPTDNCIQTD